MYWYVCWVFLAPTFMVCIFVFYFVRYSPITMGDYHYPAWGEVLGFAISLSSMLWVPGYAIYYLLSTPGSWTEVLRQGVTPVIKPRLEASLPEENARFTSQEFRDLEMNFEDEDVSGSDTSEKKLQSETWFNV